MSKVYDILGDMAKCFNIQYPKFVIEKTYLCTKINSA
jgi:hypothetical protein